MSTKKQTPKFQVILSSTGQAVLDKRSSLVFNAAKNAMLDKLQSLYRRRDALELDRLNLTDLSVESTESLRPGTKNFNAKEWIEKMTEISTELRVLEDDIEIAEAVALEYFSIEPQVQEVEEPSTEE